ncbi:hypothetical protein [Cohnella zeiphila]|uniref:Uncharacterized protein n=1 Tax=Cohnella zeiphila TaxID=2761120 RepID=A0A7X0VVT3_9BACL|nr:hypothetical protein [Cohnella zeiphila]MBB6730223.1 hypothetical protein [Cohnella zeiphila]
MATLTGQERRRMGHTAILFQFPHEKAAMQAFETLRDLGYDPQLHEGGRLHIHVEGEDLTSALEIVQAHGGEWVEQAAAPNASFASSACEPDAIPIPAHLVNEDWEEGSTYGMEAGAELGERSGFETRAEQEGRHSSAEEESAADRAAESPLDAEERELRGLKPDSGSYDHFEAR